MSDVRIDVRPAAEADLDRVEALLDAGGLPSRDVRTGPTSLFVATLDGDVIGAGGLELYGSNGLLRSLVVADGHRGQGYATTLCRTLESHAREEGVADLFLLTTTAARFFADRRYVTVDRADVPPAIRETSEFTDLCPDSATCMTKSL